MVWHNLNYLLQVSGRGYHLFHFAGSCQAGCNPKVARLPLHMALSQSQLD